MHKSLPHYLICPVCFSEDKTLLMHIFNDGIAEHVQDGVLVCKKCNSWFPIENDLLEFLPMDLAYKEDRKIFYQRFINEFQKLKISDPTDVTEIKNGIGQFEQRNHYDAFAEDKHLEYEKFKDLPLWKACDRKIKTRWSKKIINDSAFVLDVGCGTGQSSERFFSSSHNIMGIDISKKMLCKAIARAKKSNHYSRRNYIVGDATKVCFRSAIFDYAMTWGVLINLPNPIQTCSEIARVLKPQGIYFGFENNASLLRGIFDIINKVFYTWKNVTGAVPQISSTIISSWFGKNWKIDSETTVFLPPFAYNFFGEKGANVLLKTVDSFFFLLGFKNQGGLIIFEAEKQLL